jgi:3-deoxy-D-manno-octulosonate 8-phosphate phosphatase (KDO 8-P phosphatase)
VRLAVFDVDGVMTDGRLYLGPAGTEMKALNVRDGHGLVRLRRAGLKAAVISGRPSEAVAARFEELGIRHVHLNVRDKLAVYRELLRSLHLSPDQTAVMGDDEPDVAIMEQAGLAMAVSDGEACALEAAHWISSRPGGMGAVREACDLLIQAQERG